MVMQKHKTSSGGRACAALPIDALGFVERAETEVSCAADDTAREAEDRTRVALYMSGLVLVAAACVFAAMLWHRTYGSYNAPLTAAFAKYGVVTLLAVAALIAVSLVVAFAVRTKYGIDSRARAYIAKTDTLSEKRLLRGYMRRGNGVPVSMPAKNESDLERAVIAKIEPCKRHTTIYSKDKTAETCGVVADTHAIGSIDPCVTHSPQVLEEDSQTATSAGDSELTVGQDTSPVVSSSADGNVGCVASLVNHGSSEPDGTVTMVISAPVVWCVNQGGGRKTR